MMKDKPFLIASIVFGGIGLALLAIASVSFLANSTAVATAVGSIFNMNKDTVSNATLAELAIVFTIPSFIFAYKTLVDSEELTDSENFE